MKTLLLTILTMMLISSCSSGKYLLPFKKNCKYINVNAYKDSLKDGRYNTKTLMLKDGTMIYGIPKNANLLNLPVCPYRGRYFYIKQ